MGSMISKLLWITPLKHFVQSSARSMMFKRAYKLIGNEKIKELDRMKKVDWELYKQNVEDPSIEYPKYYLKEYHGYRKGNLCWEAASEAELMSLVASIKAEPNAPPVEAENYLREKYMNYIKSEIGEERLNQMEEMLDICCGIANSTFSLKTNYPKANVTGLDLSPYFLSVAKYRGEERKYNINWVHAPAESTKLPSAAFDLISMIGTTHEIPNTIMPLIAREARRLLKPEGVLVIIDVNPENIKKMPGFVYALFKSTEPDMDDYLKMDLPSILSKEGFSHVKQDNTSIDRRLITIANK